MANDPIQKLREALREVPDFPKPGILFKDITTLLSDATLFKTTIDIFLEANAGRHIDKVVGIDARGFIFGAAVAYQLGVGFIPVRKKGKLPFKTESTSYS